MRMERDQAVWLSEDDVVATVSLPEAIAAVRDGYLQAEAGDITAMPKAFASWPGGTLHAIGAVAVTSGLAVAKTWAHTAGGAAPLLLAWDATGGELVAVIEAFALGQLRTSAVTGAATRVLAAERCEVLGVVGSGKQAEGQVAAVAAVRNLREIRIFSPTQERRVAFAARVADRSGVATAAVGSVAEALDRADVVVTVTRAREPFVGRSMLKDGALVNAVGAIAPERAELEPAVAGAARVVADDVEAARRLAAREVADAAHVVPLSNVLAKDGDWSSSNGCTVFKAMGSGISDLAVAGLLIERARARGLGRALPRIERPTPRIWRAS